MPEWAISAVEHLKHSLRMQHPGWDEKKIESIAYGTVQNEGKEKSGKAPFRGQDN